MAKRTVVVLTDDIDGSDAEETITFALDGTTYEIDLSGRNAAKLRDLIAPYLAAGTKLGKGAVYRSPAAPYRPGATTRGVVRSTANYSRIMLDGAVQRASIREWAASNGLAVSERGRIKQEVVDAYQAAQRAKPHGEQPHAEHVPPQEGGNGNGNGHAVPQALFSATVPSQGTGKEAVPA